MCLQTSNITVEFCWFRLVSGVIIFKCDVFTHVSPSSSYCASHLHHSPVEWQHSKANMLIFPGGLCGVMEETEEVMVSEQRLPSGLRFGSTCQAKSDVLL